MKIKCRDCGKKINFQRNKGQSGLCRSCYHARIRAACMADVEKITN